MQEGREEDSAARTREAAAAAQTPPSTASLLGNVPLGVYSLRDHLSGDAAVRDVDAWSCSSPVSAQSCADSKQTCNRSFRRYNLKLPESLWACMFCSSCICSLPKALFWAVCMAMKRTTLEKSCVPNTFQVCAKITREQNSSNNHLPEFLYR